jgi:hypothetical protein
MDINNIIDNNDYEFSGYKGSGYLIKKYKVVEPQLSYINSLLKGFNNDTQYFFKHVLVSTLVNLDERVWIPVYSGLISAKLREASWKLLEEASLIEVSDYCMFAHRSREYKILDNLIYDFVKLGDLEAKDRIKADKFNLFDGKKTNKKEVSKTTDDNGNEYPELLKQALDVIKEGIFNMGEIKKHIAKLKEAVDKIKEEKGTDNKEYRTAFGKYNADQSCFQSILDQHPVQITKELWTYEPAYRVKMSGRIYAIKGGLQCCSKEMKVAAYTGVEGLANYDLKASQISGLLQQFEMAGLNTSWLETYRNNPEAKQVYADQIGISVSTWKKCLCSLLFGANLPKSSKVAAKKLSKAQVEDDPIKTAILGYLYEETDRDAAKTLECLAKFNKVVAPLKDELDVWHEWLVKEWALKAGRLGRGCLYLHNAAGIKFNFTEKSKKLPEWKLKSSLAAFVLQGVEASFIHNLTVESMKYSYKILSNEHDGLICVGKIPTEAVEVAAFRSGLKYAVLEEKAIA